MEPCRLPPLITIMAEPSAAMSRGAHLNWAPSVLPAGSCLALCDGTDVSPALNDAIAAYNQNSASSYHLRSTEQISGFFDGLDLVAPGVVPVSRWEPGGGDSAAEPAADTAGQDATACGIGFKR
jgi:hypothetical protein